MNRLVQPSFVLMLALLALGEITVRLTVSRDFAESFEYGFNQTAGFEETPDGMVHLLASRSRMFHPQTFARSRPEGDYRVFVIGDSVDYYDDMHVGYQLELTNTYASRLGQELRNHGMNAESYNLAVAGYGALRIQLVLRQALKYQPSLVVLKCSDGNAAWEAENYERAVEFKSWHPRNWLRKSYLVQALTVLKEDRFLDKLPWNIRTASHGAPVTHATNAPPPDIHQQEQICRTIRASVALARTQNVPVLLVTQVYHEPDATGQVKLGDHGLDAFADELRGPGVSVFSMYQLFTNQPPESVDSMFVDGTHLTRAGHRLVARALADKILADQALKQP